MDLSRRRRAGRSQQGSRLFHPQLDARAVHRPDLPRHHGDRPPRPRHRSAVQAAAQLADAVGERELSLATVAKLRIDNVTLRFLPKGSKPVTALDGISLDVAEKEFSVIVGPSGCGKSSLLRLVAGLNEPSGGMITLDGVEVIGPGKDRGMVFQAR